MNFLILKIIKIKWMMLRVDLKNYSINYRNKKNYALRKSQ